MTSEGKDRLSKLRARAADLRSSDAFAPAETGVGRAVSVEQVAADIKASRRRYRRLCALCAVVVVALAIISLPLPITTDYDHMGKAYSFGDVLEAYALFFKMNVAPLFDPTQANLVEQMANDFAVAHPESLGGGMYYQITMRLLLTLLTIVCGYMLAASGLLFQSAFRNPLAAPSMLGVSDGVQIGYVIFLFMGFTSMAGNMPIYFACAYGGGVAVLLIVLFASRFISGAKTYNVFDMLLIGTVISQMFGGIVTFVTTYFLDDDAWDYYFEMLQAVNMAEQPETYLVALLVCVIATIPVLVTRYRMNLISFPDADGRMMGARPQALRWVALLCGSLMQLAAIVSIGQVAMVSLAVPFLCRLVFPADFRKQFLGNFLLGSIILLLCQMLAHYTVFGAVAMPIGTIVGLVIMPFFVWMMAMSKKTGWME